MKTNRHTHKVISYNSFVTTSMTIFPHMNSYTSKYVCVCFCPSVCEKKRVSMRKRMCLSCSNRKKHDTHSEAHAHTHLHHVQPQAIERQQNKQKVIFANLAKFI